MAAETAQNGQSAVNEAARVAADASRRAADSARTTSQALRAYADQTREANRALYSAWTANVEASLRTAFDIQNASITAGLSMVDAAMAGNRGLAQQWAETTTKQAQQATLTGVRAGLSATQQIWEAGTRE